MQDKEHIFKYVYESYEATKYMILHSKDHMNCVSAELK